MSDAPRVAFQTKSGKDFVELILNEVELCWNFRTIYGGSEPSRNRVVVPARQAGGIDSLESIPVLLKSLKIPSLELRWFWETERILS